MTNQMSPIQASQILQSLAQNDNVMSYILGRVTGDPEDAFRVAIISLREKQQRQPDPSTGLVPCGCGVIAKVRKSQALYSGYYIVCQNINCICNVGFDRDTSGVPLGYFKTEEEAIKAWNTAMGYTAPPRPGAIGPDAGEMDQNGEEGATE